MKENEINNENGEMKIAMKISKIISEMKIISK
jgi:hypothetical protein